MMKRTARRPSSMMQPTPIGWVDVKRTDTSGWPCTIARSADILGDHWNLLIIRQACLGTRRFDDFQSALGIGRNILAQRRQPTRRRRSARSRRVPAEPATIRVPAHRQGPGRLPDPRRHGRLGRPLAHGARRARPSSCTTPHANTTCTPSWSAASAPNHSKFATSAPRPDPASRPECPRPADGAA